MDLLSSPFSAIGNAVKSTVRSVDALLTSESVPEEKACGVMYIKCAPQLKEVIVAQLAPFSVDDASNTHTQTSFVMMEPQTGAALDRESKRYVPTLHNLCDIKDHGVVAVCKRGAISIADKIRLAQDAGCHACIIIEPNDDTGEHWPAEAGDPNRIAMPVVRLGRSDGAKLQRAIREATANISGAARNTGMPGTITSVIKFAVDIAEDIFLGHDFSDPYTDMIEYLIVLSKALSTSFHKGGMARRKARLCAVMRRSFPNQPPSWDQALATLCRRPWCQFFPVHMRAEFDAAQTKLLVRIVNSGAMMTSAIETAVVAPVVLQAANATEAIAEAMPPMPIELPEPPEPPLVGQDKRVALLKAMQAERKEAHTRQGLLRRLHFVSHKEQNMSCADCSAKVKITHSIHAQTSAHHLILVRGTAGTTQSRHTTPQVHRLCTMCSSPVSALCI